jgi:hypothetical protein
MTIQREGDCWIDTDLAARRRRVFRVRPALDFSRLGTQ